MTTTFSPMISGLIRILARLFLMLFKIAVVCTFGLLPMLIFKNYESLQFWKALACHGVFMMGYAATTFAVQGFRIRISR